MLKDELIKLRNKENYSIKDVSSKLNVSNEIIEKWEKGYLYPSLDELESISSLYNVSVDELINISEKKNIYKINNKKKLSTDNIILIICIIGISIPTIFGFISLIDIVIKWLNA